MYAWGEDMSGWARPAAYKYKGGRAAKAKRREDSKLSAQKGGRSYLNRREPNMDLVSPFGRKISTESTTPLVVAVDVTGSMASWPGEIFDRLPLLYQTLSQYRPDLEISFAAIGDATSDSYPLQITDFAAGVSLEDQLNAIYGEGGGGGGKRESYELFAYYLLTQTRAPNAERPYLIIYGDEGFYPEVASAQLRYYLGGRERRNRDSLEVFGALCEAWNVFHLRKPYGAAGSAQDREIEAQWARAIGPERIVSLPSAERAVDLALGLVARGWGHYDDFEENLSARQPKSAMDMIRGRVGAVGDLR